MTIQQKLKHLTCGMSAKEVLFISSMIDGLSGMGELTDEQVEKYISKKQMKWIDVIYEKYK